MRLSLPLKNCCSLKDEAAKASLRTFALVVLFGTVAATLSEEIGTPWLLTGGLLAIGLALLILKT